MAWFNLRRLTPAISAAAAVVVAVFTFQVLHPDNRSPQRGFAAVEVQDVEIVADLDVLVSNDDDDDTSLL